MEIMLRKLYKPSVNNKEIFVISYLVSVVRTNYDALLF